MPPALPAYLCAPVNDDAVDERARKCMSVVIRYSTTDVISAFRTYSQWLNQVTPAITKALLSSAKQSEAAEVSLWTAALQSWTAAQSEEHGTLPAAMLAPLQHIARYHFDRVRTLLRHSQASRLM